MAVPDDGSTALFDTQFAMARSDQLKHLFEHPASPVHRRFEICRAYYHDDWTAKAIAQRFQLHVDSVRAIVRDFAAHADIGQFFQSHRPGRKTSPLRDTVRQPVVGLRRKGATLGQICQQLESQGQSISESYLATILRQEGFTALGHRRRPPSPGERACDGSVVPEIADVRAFKLEPGRDIRTHVAGLFLFVPLLLESDIQRAISNAQYPGTQQIPALQAILGLLAAKLIGKRRVSHINDLNTDEGAGVFAGLNILPKTTYATSYSYRTQRQMNERFVDSLVERIGLEEPPQHFNLDFHAIPFRGKDCDLEKHWVPKQHRPQPAVMAFVAQESSRRVMCYATANVIRDEADAMVVKFADHWKQRTGHYPGRLLFDSRATTYSHLHELNQRDVGFITIRRRGAAMVNRVRSLPPGDWNRCQITQAKQKRRQVKYVEEMVKLDDYSGEIRQVIFDGLGHETPTFLLTNDKPEKLTARQVIETYGRRNHVEHSLGEKIGFFHLDCLASDVRLNVDFDLTLSVAAALLYHRLGQRLKGFREATPQNLFRKFVNTPGRIEIATNRDVFVHFEKRSHNPILKEAGFDQATNRVPWLQGRSVHMFFT